MLILIVEIHIYLIESSAVGSFQIQKKNIWILNSGDEPAWTCNAMLQPATAGRILIKKHAKMTDFCGILDGFSYLDILDIFNTSPASPYNFC